MHASFPFDTAQMMLCESLKNRRELILSYPLIVIFQVSLVRILTKVISSLARSLEDQLVIVFSM
jgi:hypothetical protein